MDMWGFTFRRIKGRRRREERSISWACNPNGMSDVLARFDLALALAKDKKDEQINVTTIMALLAQTQSDHHPERLYWIFSFRTQCIQKVP